MIALIGIVEHEFNNCVYKASITGTGNTKNHANTTRRHIRYGNAGIIGSIMGNCGIYPKLNKKARTNFRQMVGLMKYWCDRDLKYERTAMLLMNKFRSSKVKTGDKYPRCFSSTFASVCNNDAIHFNATKSTSAVSAIIPMLLVVGQNIFDNSERTSLEAHPLMKGGTLNGKTPNLPFVKGDDGKKVTTLIQRAAHCYLYNASVNQMPTGGCQITYDNQVQLNPTTKRKGGPNLPGVPVNPAAVAYVAFEPLAGEDYVLGTSELEKTKREWAETKRNAGLDPQYDLCRLSCDEAEEDQPPLVNPGDEDEKPRAVKVRPEPIIETVVELAQHVYDATKVIDQYKPSTSLVAAMGRDDDDSDDENNALLFKQNVEEEVKIIDALICDIAAYTKMSGTSSCKSILMHQAIGEIRDTKQLTEATAINRYLILAVEEPQTPSMTKEYRNLKQSHLKLIVENFGFKYNSGMLTAAKEANILTDGDIEKGLASIEFKGIIKTQGLDVRNMVDNGVEDDISNILKTQKVWSSFGWVSNIDHMKSMNCTDEDFTRIKMIIWMKKDTVYTDFIKLMRDDSEDEMNEDSDEGENDSESE